MLDGIKLHETTQGDAFREAKVEGNVISNVALLGAASKNGRTYTKDAMQDAARLYQGVRIYPDHPSYNDLTGTGNRKFEDLMGQIRNTRVSGDRVRGDVVLISAHPAGERLKTFAVEAPDLVGFSHRAEGEGRQAEDGTVIIERILSVDALEVVTAPATTSGLFESEFKKAGTTVPPERKEDEMEIKDLSIQTLEAQRPDLLKAIREAAVAEAQTAAQATDVAKAQKAKIETLEATNKDLQKKLDESTVREAARVRADLVGTKLSAAKLPEAAVTDTFRKSLTDAKDEAEIDALIADRKAVVEAARPGTIVTSEARKIDGVVAGGKKGEVKPVTEATLSEAHSALFG